MCLFNLKREYHLNIKKLIIRGGNKIHALIASTFQAVEISEASPGWQEYINFANEIIFNGFKASSLNSLNNMHTAMTDPAVRRLLKSIITSGISVALLIC